MTGILLVGAGSFIGGVLRYGLSDIAHRSLGGPIFPYGTVAVNLLGSLAIGFLAGAAGSWVTLNADTRLFLFTGILGGFTTFSAFTFDTFALARDGHHGAALVNIALQLCLGVAAVWFGHMLAHAAARFSA